MNLCGSLESESCVEILLFANMQLSIIIPVLNESAAIENTLAALDTLRHRGAEVIVVDGGSTDDTVALAIKASDRILLSSSGRAVQMNLGAKFARGDYLLFLHADTLMSDNAQMELAAAIREQHLWGRFDVRLSGRSGLLRVVESAMNLRSRLTGIATGDQAIFVRNGAFQDVGGYPEIALMEDIELSKRLKQRGQPICLNSKVVSDSRRWEEHGIVRTIILMWSLRLLYFLGVDIGLLAKVYTRKKR